MVEANKQHYRNGRFINLYATDSIPNVLGFLKWQWQRLWKHIPPANSYNFRLNNCDVAFLKENRDNYTATWIGHATILLQMEGKNILTDPHFSDRASPVPFFGPKRVVPPAIPIYELPFIDIVIISHDHYDALDKNSVINLYKRPNGEKTLFFVPLGLKRWFIHHGIHNVVELDWWEDYKIDNIVIAAVPAQHWSKRGLLSKNKTLWAGWVVYSETFRFFFAGDTGYSPIFKEIGKRFGPFDLSAIPIGAYEPRWFMRNHHVTPEEALQIHIDVNSKRSIAIHWGTFILTDEPLDEPPKRLIKEMKRRSISEDEFLILKHGETLLL
ncbi:MAG: MBL fold metallo-hydrolase [Nitrospirae bacterium]|nr:MAG: MBL fold metallo-hydrolase [Nitrospirota bacterium]